MQAATSLIRNLLRAALFFVLCSAVVSASVAANAQTLALVGGRVYPSPDAVPLLDAVVLASDGVITAVGSRSDVQMPPDARVIDCAGKTVVAGFWNSHVHFTEAVWKSAAGGPAAPLTAHMQEMLTRWGFTTVWDLGADPDRCAAAAPPRQGRRSRTAPTSCLPGISFPRAAIPFICLAEVQLPEAATPEEAAQNGARFLGMGLDGMKLFTGSFMGDDKPVTNMDAAVARAAVDVAHAQGKPVFAHPQNRAASTS